MKKLILADLRKALDDIGIKQGDHLLMSSSLMPLGIPEGGLKTGVPAIIDLILEMIGEQGTLVAPTFTLDFPHHQNYHYLKTPSVAMGVLNEAIRTHEHASRTRHPISSLSAIGYHRDALYGLLTPSAYAKDSAYDFIYQQDFKILLLATDGRPVTLSHFAEEQAQVPYRYDKEITGRVEFAEGIYTKPWSLFARNLAIDPKLNENHTMNLLKVKKLWVDTTLNDAQIHCCSGKIYVNLLMHMLKENPFFLLDNAEQVKAYLAQKS